VRAISTIRVLIADDHLMVRQGLVAMLSIQPEIEVVGEASDGQELVALAGTLRPGVILSDISLPKLDGIEATGLIHKEYSDMGVILLADGCSAQLIIRALRKGALGFLVRTEDFKQVLEALKAVNSGRRFLSSQVSDHIIDAVVAGKSMDENLDEQLSDRELEILQLIAEGLTSAEIAVKLEISKRTAETHRTNIMRKLGINSQIEIIRMAFRNGLISLD
jgi:Response regulator containing a CheY-like receiver domain and an HTH DNA-binding domain